MNRAASRAKGGSGASRRQPRRYAESRGAARFEKRRPPADYHVGDVGAPYRRFGAETVRLTRICLLAIMLAGCAASRPATTPAPPISRVTILVDSFGVPSALRQDWGFSALVEHGGKRILFDTGNTAEFFAHNTRHLGVDLTNLDFVVISHRHGDHTDGLHHLLKVNPQVEIYTPADEYFGGPTPAAFFRNANPSLPSHMRYFHGNVPADIPHGSPWKHARITRVAGLQSLTPGIKLVSNVSPTRAFGETPELSLAIETAGGLLLVVGCSHPGIERILASVGAPEKRVRLVVGGLHLLMTPQPEVDRLAIALRDEWKVGEIAPGHCTGEHAFTALQTAFGSRYRFAGVGSILDVP